ncbi:MAG TPA: NAD(P)-binding domain-containing protein [Fibrobacteria bacterium]|nr:NAD(P)-binding domain-containing protein [Fibrobacteria bacterium]
MKIAILGTGMVGTTIGSKMIELGHKVKMGARVAGNEKAAAWAGSAGPDASQGTFAEAAAFGELAFNCTSGAGSMEALQQAGAANLKGKILIDISNPLDFSKGMPPSLSVCNTDSLGERIQKALPDTKVVKTLNTTSAPLMVDPGQLAGGDHTMFLCGDDAEAKARVLDLLKNGFGWKDVVDLGDITAARGQEMILPLWLRTWGTLKTANFNYKVVR